jgi:hypothetical protein
MNEYHKINSIYLRDPANNHKTFLEGQWAQPEFGLLDALAWDGTEKIDGTNIRVIWDGTTVRFGGKTDNADIPAVLSGYLNEHFTPERMAAATQGPVTLYGEGYGGKIQKGSRYRQEQRFILFDVWAAHDPLGVWLSRETVTVIGAGLDVPVVPIVYHGTLSGAIQMVRDGFTSTVAEDSTLMAEGLVLRPQHELRDRLGRRIITKIKHRDWPESQKGSG